MPPRPARLPLLALGIGVLVASGGVGRAAEPPPSPAAIDEAIDRGVAWLVGEQEPTGAFDTGSRALGHTALAVYALLHAGLEERTSRPLGRALAYLDRTGPGRTRRPDREARTYETALLVLVLCDRGRQEDRERTGRLVRVLERMQASNGQWSYELGHERPTAGDNSNAQFAVLALGAAVGDGVPVDPEALHRAWGWWRTSSGRDGGFGYASGGAPDSQSTGSMTAAGIASLAILEAAFAGASTVVGEKDRAVASRALSRAVDRLAEGFSVETNFGPAQGGAGQRQRNAGRGWLHYYLWSVERAMVLAGRETIGGRDWYAEGARRLLATQAKDGSWRGELPLYATSFALLFLTRAADPPRAFTPREDAPGRAVTPGPEPPPATPLAPAPPGAPLEALLAANVTPDVLLSRALDEGPPCLDLLVRALEDPDGGVRRRANELLRLLLGDERVGLADRHPLARGRLALWVRRNRRFLVARDGRFVLTGLAPPPAGGNATPGGSTPPPR